MPNIPNNFHINFVVGSFLQRSNPASVAANLDKVFKLVYTSEEFRALPDEQKNAILNDVVSLELMVNLLPNAETVEKNVRPILTPVKPPAKPPVRLTQKWRRKAKPSTPYIMDIPPGMAG
jgi:hypothetical protein